MSKRTIYITEDEISDAEEEALLEDAINNPRTTPDEVRDSLIRLLALLKHISLRADVSEEVRALIINSPDHIEARNVAKAYL